ncbi:DnaD domain protein [Virgibacillus halodenitrificans]|nr:DnaD domain protein [Virgibacillus halodenitrificans]
MNYIKQMNAFHLKIDLEPISIQARSLWLTLIDINNKLLWRKTFTVAASKLQDKSGLSASSFKRARIELEENGFIQVTSQGGNQAAVYHVVQLYADTSSEMEPHEEKVDYTPDQKLSHKLSPLIKHKQKTKIKEKQEEEAATGAKLFYFDNFGEPNTYITEELIYWINDVGDALVIQAMKRSLEQGKSHWGYVKAILHAWRNKGIEDVAAAKEEENNYRVRKEVKEQKTNLFDQLRQEQIPDWFIENKREQAEMAAQKRERTPEEHLETKEEQREELERLLARFS